MTITTLRQTPPLTLDYRVLDALTLDPNNPRTHSKTQIGQIAKSIRSFGFGVPILVDAEDKVLCGHGRIEAARLLGLETVPVVCLAHLTAAEAKAFQIADNRLTELGGWDEVQLAQTLQALSLQHLSFDLDATGFELAEIDLKIQGLSLEGDEASDEEEAPCNGARGDPAGRSVAAGRASPALRRCAEAGELRPADGRDARRPRLQRPTL